jgi:hypothetical protein
MPFSSLFTNPYRAQEVRDEEAHKRFIDVLLSYRTREVLIALGVCWLVILVMVFTFVATFALALRIPSMIHAGW